MNNEIDKRIKCLYGPAFSVIVIRFNLVKVIPLFLSVYKFAGSVSAGVLKQDVELLLSKIKRLYL
jgi:hypothetical protein